MAKFTNDQKLEEVIRYQNTNDSVEEIAKSIDAAQSVVRNWRIQLKTSGMDALFFKKKGRPFMKKDSNKQPKQAPIEGSTEALQARIKQLEMENEYLKKLNALVQAKGKSPRKTK